MQVEIHDVAERRVLALTGDLDPRAVLDLEAELDTLVPERTCELVIDLDGLSYLDSTGMRLFIRLRRALAAVNKHLVFVNTSPRIFRVFQFCGLDGYFTFVGQPTLARGA